MFQADCRLPSSNAVSIFLRNQAAEQELNGSQLYTTTTSKPPLTWNTTHCNILYCQLCLVSQRILQRAGSLWQIASFQYQASCATVGTWGMYCTVNDLVAVQLSIPSLETEPHPFPKIDPGSQLVDLAGQRKSCRRDLEAHQPICQHPS